MNVSVKISTGSRSPASNLVKVTSETEPTSHLVIWEKPSERTIYIWSDTENKWVIMTGF